MNGTKTDKGMKLYKGKGEYIKWWFHDVLLSEVKKRTSKKIADNFGSHDANDTALQDPQVEWIFLPLTNVV